MRIVVYALAAIASAALLFAAANEVVGLSLSEALGFVTGAWTVWLVVRENIWNWPIGIANSAFYIVVFFQARLYADMTLQGIYIVLGILGWYWWLRGAAGKPLQVGRVPLTTAVACAVVGVVATAGMTVFLQSIDDAAPFLDALTTVLSLIAQFLLTKKYLENWAVWITADIIYIGLYASRGLYLTSVLYILFLTMCVIGLRRWWAARLVPA